MKQDQLPQIDRASARDGSVVDPVKKFPYIYFDQHATSYSVHAFKKSPKNLGMLEPSPLAWRRGWPHASPLPVLPCHIWSLWVKPYTSIITYIRQNNLTVRVPPFNVSQCHWNRHGSIGYLWLHITYMVTMCLCRAVFQIIGNFGRKSQIFPTPCI